MDRRSTAPILILLLISLAVACSFLRPKRPLTWHVTLEIDPNAPDRDATAKKTISVIKRRLDLFGISNFDVQAHGTQSSNRILVSLPDVPDREHLKQIISTLGRLQLMAVVGPPNPAPSQTYSSETDAVSSLGGMVPTNRRVLLYAEQTKLATGGKSAEQPWQEKRWVVVELPPIVDGDELRNASAIQSRDSTEDYQIAFSLKSAGAERFGAWTGSHINNYIAVVLNDEVKSIAYIKSQIFGQGEISGRFTKQSAEDLAQVLNSGSLPARVRIVEEGLNK